MSVRYFLAAVFCGLGLTIAAPANATILVNEDFGHSDGALVGQTPTPGPGGTWAAFSGAGNKPIQVSSGTISLEQSSGSGEDVATSYTAQSATATTYARFDFSLPSGQTVDPDGSGLYFALFKDDGTSTFRGRTGVLSPAAGGDFQLAINADSSDLGSGAQWASDLSFDTTYTTVISWNAATGESKLWLDPVNEASTSISHTGSNTGTLLSTFAFRQSNDYTGSQIIDNLCVATSFDQALTCTPEPTSLLLMVFGMAGIATRRRL